MLYKQIAEEAMDKVEIVSNLAYLIRADADNPELVRTYTNDAETQLIELTRLLRRFVLEVKSREVPDVDKSALYTKAGSATSGKGSDWTAGLRIKAET